MTEKTEKGGIYAPTYYDKFKCIADKCRHSCCIDWEICIDGETYEKYKKLPDISKTIKDSDDGACFELCKDGRCPHLNENGLCDIIISHGEGYLSEICQNHPRFYNYISDSYTEAGLGMVCEEACRLILEDEQPFSLVKIEEFEIEIDGEMCFDALPERDHIIARIDGNGTFDDKIMSLKNEFDIHEIYTPDEWLDRLLSLEILDAAWKKDLQSMRTKLFAKSNDLSREYGKYYERLLMYFVYRHVSMSDSQENLRARLAFSILSVDVIRSLFEENTIHTLEKLMDISRRYSAEIEYSEDNTAELIYAFESALIEK